MHMQVVVIGWGGIMGWMDGWRCRVERECGSLIRVLSVWDGMGWMG